MTTRLRRRSDAYINLDNFFNKREIVSTQTEIVHPHKVYEQWSLEITSVLSESDN